MPEKKLTQSQAVKALDSSHIDIFAQSDARFRALFDTAVAGIGLMSLDRKVIDANPAMCRMLGLTREELIGKSPEIATYPEDFPQATQEFEDMLAGKKDYYWTERRYVRKDGEIFWAHVTISIVRDAEGNPLYMVGIVMDIDKQRHAQEDLIASEKRFRAIFENAGVGMAVVGLDRRALAVNDAMVKLSGYSRQELLDTNGFDLTYPPDREIGLTEFHELLAGKRDTFQVERRYLHKKGHPYWVRHTISAVRADNGSISYLILMMEDIDQQKQNQERLRESEARFRAMFDNVSVGMSLLGLNRRVLAMNQTAERIVGYTCEEMSNLDPVELALLEDRDVGAEEFREMVEGVREGFQMEKRYMRRDGSVFWARVTYSLVRDQSGAPLHLIGLIEDINEQKLASEMLAMQEAEYRRTLEQRVEERTHNLIETNLRLVNEIEQRQRAEEVLARKAVEEAISAERTRLARDLHDAVTQTLFSASLIAEVLPDLWKLNEAEAHRSTEELRQLTRGALAEMRTLLLELRPAALTQARFRDLMKQLSEAVTGRARLPITLAVEGEYELPPEVKVAFYRIAQESLNNIVKYSRATHVEIRASLDCCNVHLEIKDNGVGFDPKTIKPTSLGMRIMRERADSIRAHFSIASSPGNGTTVSVDWNEDD